MHIIYILYITITDLTTIFYDIKEEYLDITL